jgi:hypothetical protein
MCLKKDFTAEDAENGETGQMEKEAGHSESLKVKSQDEPVLALKYVKRRDCHNYGIVRAASYVLVRTICTRLPIHL